MTIGGRGRESNKSYWGNGSTLGHVAGVIGAIGELDTVPNSAHYHLLHARHSGECGVHCNSVRYDWVQWSGEGGTRTWGGRASAADGVQCGLGLGVCLSRRLRILRCKLALVLVAAGATGTLRLSCALCIYNTDEDDGYYYRNETGKSRDSEPLTDASGITLKWRIKAR